MIAAVLEEIGKGLAVSNIEKPTLLQDEILVEILASAINHRDIYISKGEYAAIKTPCVLGSDGAGKIVEVGNSSLNHHLGKEVIINPNNNWGDNENFQSSNYHILGMPSYGTFAQFVKVKIDRVHPKPNHLSFEEAAALPLAGLTAYRAVFTKGNLETGQKVLINGIGGGVAQFAFLFAKAAGAEVFVTSGKTEKLQASKDMGADKGYNYTDTNWYKKLNAEVGGVDLVIDSAGGEGFGNLLKIMNPGGRLVTYGGTKGKVTNLSPQILFWKQLNILGTTMGSDEDFKNMLAFVSEKKIKPTVDKVFALANINEAFEYVSAQKQFGKVVISG